MGDDNRRRRRRKRGGSRNKQASPKKKPFDPEKHYMPPPRPDREYEPDPVTGEPIADILSAIADPSTGKPSNFDSVINRLSESHDLKDDERIAYIGRGEFGIVAEERVEGKKRLVVRERIHYEDNHRGSDWRKELSPGISRDYVPDPQPIEKLYEPDDEIVRRPYGRVTGTSYMPHSN